MATVTITITDDGTDGKLPSVGVSIKSKPDVPLNTRGEPDLEAMTPAQAAAWGCVLGLSEGAGASKLYTQDGDTITELVSDPNQRREL